MIKELLSNIVIWFLVALWAIGIILIYGAIRKFPPNLYFLSAGVLATGIPILIFMISHNRQMRIYNEDRAKALKHLKTKGTRIPVDLTACTIKSNRWMEERARYDESRIVFLNEISGHGDKNVNRVDINVSILQYTHHIKGRKRRFTSHAIYKGRTTLSMLLEMQKETFIYIDPDNPRRYYFDLEFLGEEEAA